MKIESILRRTGGTQIDIGGVHYHFKPETVFDGAPHVASIDDPIHIKHLLSITEGYRKAKGEADLEGSGDALVLTVPQPPSESDLIDVLTSLGAANPPELLSIAWPDRFPAKAEQPKSVKTVAPTISAPAASTNGGAAGPNDAQTNAPKPAESNPPPTITIGAIPPTDPDPADSTGPAGAEGADKDAPEKRLAEMSDEQLRAEFERVVGRRAHHKALHETMAAQILAALHKD